MINRFNAQPKIDKHKKVVKTMHVQKNPFFIIRISRKKFPSSGTFYQKFILISSFDNFSLSTQMFCVKVKRLAGEKMKELRWYNAVGVWKKKDGKKVRHAKLRITLLIGRE